MKFYTVKVEFLIEADSKAEAEKLVTQHNFTKLNEGSQWHNFTVSQVKKIKESELV